MINHIYSSRKLHRDKSCPEFYYFDNKNIPQGWITATEIHPLLFALTGYGMRYLDEHAKIALFNWSIVCRKKCDDLDVWLEWYCYICNIAKQNF